LRACVHAQVLAREGLRVHDIPADGNCLFHAVAHQLAAEALRDEGGKQQVHVAGAGHLRCVAAQHMLAHRADYEPFFSGDAADGGRGETTAAAASGQVHACAGGQAGGWASGFTGGWVCAGKTGAAADGCERMRAHACGGAHTSPHTAREGVRACVGACVGMLGGGVVIAST
jgi:hypothetical protein